MRRTKTDFKNPQKPKNTFRKRFIQPHLPISSRFNQFILTMRKHGYSMNHIQKATSISLSHIHKTIKNAEILGAIHHISNRKLPRNLLLQVCRRRLNQAYSWAKRWETYLLGEEEQPP